MFEWLDKELAEIKTPKFHLIDGPAADDLRQAVESSDFPIPPSYKAFVLQYGNAKLYRTGSYYKVVVFGGPREAESNDNEVLIHFGKTHTSLAYFKESLLVAGQESPVFEWSGPDGGLRQSAAGFEEWLAKKCKAARKQFGREEWSSILKGPKPFTEEELAVVEARKRFRWQIVGVAENDDMQFEVHNGSDRTLPYLTIGVRGKHGQVQGGVWLPVSHIGPGQSAVVEKDCYKRHLAPEDVEAFNEPDPEPEDRDRYWEFKAMA